MKVFKWILIFLLVLILVAGIAFGSIYFVTQNAKIGKNKESDQIAGNTTATESSLHVLDVPINIQSYNINAPTAIPEDKINITLNEYGLELPINGATGYTSISMNLYEQNNKQKAISTLSAGTAFKIIKEDGNWWLVEVNGTQGWLEHLYCMINLPDVIPSIIYDDTNSYKSIFKSAKKDINGITGQTLYNVIKYNERFSEEQYLMPVLYTMAKKICTAQNKALQNGDSLKIYETFRPYEVQMKVSNALSALINSDKEVSDLINVSPWNKSWFIATTLSNHQRGIAMDVSLVKITAFSHKSCGNYAYVKIDGYNEYTMPTAMHELSSLAVTFTTAVSSHSKTEWKSAKFAPTMTEPAKKLQSYCTSSNLHPLCSEWWHFNDLDAREAIGSNYSTGKFYITKSFSSVPE